MATVVPQERGPAAVMPHASAESLVALLHDRVVAGGDRPAIVDGLASGAAVSDRRNRPEAPPPGFASLEACATGAAWTWAELAAQALALAEAVQPAVHPMLALTRSGGTNR